MDQQDLAEPMRSRWSPSVFDDTHQLGDREIAGMLTAARWAPSCGNAQPWRFLVLRRGGPGHRVFVEHLSRGNAGWVPRASAVFVVGAQWAPDEAGEGGYKPAYADYDTGQAAAHLTLEAHALGLHTHQFAGFDHDAVATGLGVPSHVRVLAGIAVGVRGNPADVPEKDSERDHRVRRRHPIEELASGESWAMPWQGETS